MEGRWRTQARGPTLAGDVWIGPGSRQPEVFTEMIREQLDDPGNHNPDQLLDVTAAAALLGMARGALRATARMGIIQRPRIRRRLLFRRGDLVKVTR